MNKPFPAVVSILSAQHLSSRVLSRYSLAKPVVCQFFNQGMNDTYQVKTNSSTYYLRVYTHGWRTRAQIEAEIDMLLRLSKKGLSVSSPLRRKDGAYLTRIHAAEGIRYATLFTSAPGARIKLAGQECRAFGELTARIHVSLNQGRQDSRRFHLDVSHLVLEPLRALEPFLKNKKKDLHYLRSSGTQLYEKLDNLLPKTSPYYGSCHGDLHPGNLHVDSKGAMTLFDFDCGGYGWRAYDVAVFRWAMTNRFGLSGTERGRTTRLWNAFLSGYESVREFGAAEREAVVISVPLRHLWGIGSAVQVSNVRGCSFLGDAYAAHVVKFIKDWIAYHKISVV